MPAYNDQIIRLYDTVFDRAPDASGLAFWNAAADNGYGLHEIADLFMTTPEFADTYGQPDDLSFVQAMYRNVLDRPGESGGVAFWTQSLTARLADRSDIVLQFSESAEHRTQMAAAAAKPVPVVLVGSRDDDAIGGGGGDDELTGLLGADTLFGGAGDDVLWGGLNLSTDPNGWAGLAGDGGDVLDGGPGNDRLHGDHGADTLDGGPGNDTLEGFTHSDLLVGGLGDDVLYGDAVSVQSARLLGFLPGNDTLDGGGGDDRLNGGAGNDVLVGGAGNDVLEGWVGADTMSGGAGSDRFQFGWAINGGAYMTDAARDVITDFGSDDRMDLERFMPNDAFTYIGTAAFTASGRPEVHWETVTDGVLVQVDAPPGVGAYGAPNGQADTEILVLGMRALDAGSFIL